MKHSFKKSWTVILTLLALTFSATGVTPAYAAPLVVVNADDSGAGSLRAAISSAGIGDTIIFDASLSGATIHLASTLTLFQNVTIDGSALASQITISGDTNSDGTGDVRVVYVNSGVTAILNSLIITKGTDINGGGGIFNEGGMLTVTNSALSGNSATNGGGAIFNYNGTLNVMNSTLSSNSADFGGGIENTGTLTVTNSTLSDNSSGGGGGIYNTGTLAVTNSTLSGNSVTSPGAAGGGIFNDGGTLTITNSTLSGNSATANNGGGIFNNGGTLNYANTIIANSSSLNDCFNNATIGTNTKNLVEDNTCSPAVHGDPKLGPLANNGGSTWTLALLAGSPAIDAGNDSVCTNSPVSGLDQRGATRSQGAHCDIGAFELEAYTLSIISANGTVAKNLDQVTYHEGDVVQLTATPNAGWSFVNWTGGLTSSVNPDSVTIHGNISVTANYLQIEYTLFLPLILR
jgi:hypothetical protein